MEFFRKQTKTRSLAAMIAAYAIVLHAFFGGIVVSQNASVADGFVICHGIGNSGAGGTQGSDKAPLPAKSVSCALLCASHAAGTVPQALPEVLAEFVPSAVIAVAAPAPIWRSDEHTPHLAQAPPQNA